MRNSSIILFFLRGTIEQRDRSDFLFDQQSMFVMSNGRNIDGNYIDPSTVIKVMQEQMLKKDASISARRDQIDIGKFIGETLREHVDLWFVLKRKWSSFIEFGRQIPWEIVRIRMSWPIFLCVKFMWNGVEISRTNSVEHRQSTKEKSFVITESVS